MTAPPERLFDGHGRRIRYLRVSLTDRCNFRCGFCMPAEPDAATRTAEPLSTHERLRLCSLFFRMGVDSFKITGGEPFMVADALPTLRRLKEDLGAAGVTVTTNGSTLDRHARELAAIGVDGVNVSLNAMSPDAFRRVTGGDFPLRRVLDGILLAKGLGLDIKLNMVPIHGLNDGEALPLLEFALEHDLHLRFIELMPIGRARSHRGVSFDELVGMIEKRHGPIEASPGRLGSGPATYFAVAGRRARIGFIAAVSDRFCGTCNRVRLTSAGFLKSCLFHRHGVDLAGPLRSGETDAGLAGRIAAAVGDKPDRHHFAEAGDGGAAAGDDMYRIGG